MTTSQLMTEDLLTVGQVADHLGVTVRTLHHYDEIGLVVPSARSRAGYRLYTEADVEKVLVIRRMKPLGFSLDQMKAVMRDIEALDDPATGAGERDAVRQRLDEIRQDATERRRALVRQLEMADEFIDLITTRRG